MAANKQQLQTISLTLEDKDKAIDTLKDQVKLLEKQLAGNLKKILLQSEATVIENGETQVHDLLFFSSLSLSDFPPVNEHFWSLSPSGTRRRMTRASVYQLLSRAVRLRWQ